MIVPVWGSNDILVGHIVDDFGTMHRTWAGDLGGFMGNASVQMGRFWLSGFEDPDFAEREAA